MEYHVYVGNDFAAEIRNYNLQGQRGKAWLWGRVTTLLLSRAAGVIARGKYLQSLCSAYNGNVIRTAPLGNMHLMPRGAIAAGDRRRAGKLVFLGRLSIGKGLELLLQAIADLRVQAGTREAVGELVVIGTGVTEEANRALARQLKIDDRVSFRGFIANPLDVAEELQTAALLVVPTSTFPEGVPRAIEEALALRVPVVATAVGGIPAEFDDGSVRIVAPGDVAALREAIAALLTSPAHYAEALAAIERRMGALAWNHPADQHWAFVTGRAAG